MRARNQWMMDGRQLSGTVWNHPIQRLSWFLFSVVTFRLPKDMSLWDWNAWRERYQYQDQETCDSVYESEIARGCVRAKSWECWQRGYVPKKSLRNVSRKTLSKLELPSMCLQRFRVRNETTKWSWRRKRSRYCWPSETRECTVDRIVNGW